MEDSGELIAFYELNFVQNYVYSGCFVVRLVKGTDVYL
jgi:hypothetical protein